MVPAIEESGIVTWEVEVVADMMASDHTRVEVEAALVAGSIVHMKMDRKWGAVMLAVAQVVVLSMSSCTLHDSHHRMLIVADSRSSLCCTQVSDPKSSWLRLLQAQH